MKNYKKIVSSVALSALMIGGSSNGALPTRTEKISSGIASAVISSTVFGGGAYMLKKHMDTIDIKKLSELFGARILQLKSGAALGLTVGVIAGAVGLYGMKQSFTSKERLGIWGRCKKFGANTMLVGASALATTGCCKVLAISARSAIEKYSDIAYNVKAFIPLIVTGMVATGAYLGYRGLREIWDGIRNKGCAPLTVEILQERARHALNANPMYAEILN